MNKAQQALISRYFNTGQLSRSDLIKGLISPTLPFRSNALAATELHSKSRSISKNLRSETYHIPAYAGSHPAVISISAFLSKHLANDLAGAYVHGSLSTHDYVDYSDFDGLLILRDDVFSDPARVARVAIDISRSFSLMIDFDTLQHHGWFILTEKDLNEFPLHYFPPVLFNHASSLLPQGTELTLKIGEPGHTYQSQLKRVALSVIKKTENGKGLKNMFALKALLSEFMLLPSLFIETKTGKGIYKKYSFEAARPYFSDDEWAVMDEISRIRSEWKYSPSWKPPKTPFITTPFLRKLQASKAGALPVELTSKLTPAFTARMRNLAALFIEKSA